MRFSTKTRYGLRAMLEIGKADQEIGIFQKDIAKNQEISLKYLDAIISSLKVAGLIVTVKGKKSGYILTRKASEITMLDIHNAFEAGICIIDCLSQNVHCDRKMGCASRGFWGRLNNIIVKHFKSVTLQDIIDNRTLLDDTELMFS